MVDEMTDEDWRDMDGLWDQSFKPLLETRRVSAAIDLVRSLLETETRPARRLHLLRFLIDFLTVDGQHDKALAVIHQCIELDPEDALNWQSLAGWYFYGNGSYNADEETLKHALEAINMAVEKARVRGDLRFALNDRCRIVIAMKRYDLLEKSLREILAMPPDTAGIQLEGDFLPQVPRGTIEQRVLDEYRAALAEQEARRAKRRPSD